MLFRNFFKKIFTIYLIISLTLFSPISYALPPVVAGSAVATAVMGLLNSPTAKKVLKEIGKEIFGGDDDDNDVKVGSDTVILTNYGECSTHFASQSYKGSFYSSVNWLANKFKDLYDMDKVYYRIDQRSSTFYVIHISYTDKYYPYFGHVTCPHKKEKELTAQEIVDEIEKRAKKKDKDAQDLLDEIKKHLDKDKDDDSSDSDKDKKDKSDDDTSDDKDKSDDDKDKKDKDKSDDDDDTSSDDECKAKKDDDDTSKECKDKSDDDTAKKDDDDDKTCNSSAFHKKVCDWIDWTYDETDKAKKKIADFFSDDEIDDIDKKKLNELVDEEDVALKKYDFDVIDACPAPKSVIASIFGRTVEIEVFNFQGICKYAGFIEFALQTTATIVGINIIAGRKME